MAVIRIYFTEFGSFGRQLYMYMYTSELLNLEIHTVGSKNVAQRI